MSIDKTVITQVMSDRTSTIVVSTEPSTMPSSPVMLVTHTEYSEQSGFTNDSTQVALSLENARALQHALLTAINEAEQQGPGGAA